MTKGDPLEAPTQEKANQRVLTRIEVGAVVRTLGESGHDAAARFMLLTGARREEVCGATWREIESGIWAIPGARRKDTRPNTRRPKEDHVIALPRQAVAFLDGLRAELAQVDNSAPIFAGERGARLTNWPRWSARIKRRLGFDVTPHTLRRTCATLAGDLGHPPHVVSALLGHRAIGGSLHAGYNQSRYRAEVADALQMVADLLDALRAGTDNIVAIRQRPI
jgi:integrase